MTAIIISFFTAFWLGILTSISPCPLATNIAATGFISKTLDNPKRSIYSSIFYVLGRSIAYIAVAALIIGGLLSIPSVSMFLQKYLNKILGPLLILVGMYLLGLIHFSFYNFSVSAEQGEKLTKKGFIGAFFLGFLFALSFCPVSAALFFGSLIPLAVSSHFPFLLPLFYGIGTGIPVVIVAIVFVYSATFTFRILKIFKNVEKVGSIFTGLLFVFIGIYFSINYIFLA